MNVYKTNAGLANNEWAYFVRLENDLYLCIDTKFWFTLDRYIAGQVDEFESMHIKPSNYKLSDSPIFNTFLFQYWYKNQINPSLLEAWLYSEGRLFYHFYDPNLTPKDPQDEGDSMTLSQWYERHYDQSIINIFLA
jgi:FAD/FMN-containing dehydrogenase